MPFLVSSAARYSLNMSFVHGQTFYVYHLRGSCTWTLFVDSDVLNSCHFTLLPPVFYRRRNDGVQLAANI